MSKVLIVAHEHDLHAQIVRFALSDKGFDCLLWSVPQFAMDQVGAIVLGSNAAPGISLRVGTEDLDLATVNTVWARRPVFPRVPETADKRDHHQIKQENSLFVQGLWWALDRSTFWVNPYSARRRIKSKPIQLIEADSVGLRIPDTIFGNDSTAIREFCSRHKDGGIVYKPHRISEWNDDEGKFLLHTSPFHIENFTNQEIELCAGTYQEHIAKDYELRIHVFGKYITAMKIDSQKNPSSRIDWRSADPRLLLYEKFDLDMTFKLKILRLMENLGAVFGIIDAIVTPSGDFIFLEINEMGQFLWADAYCPDMNLLDHLCSFLMHGAGDYRGELQGKSVDYKKIRSSQAFIERFHASKVQYAAPEYEVDWIDVFV